MYEPVLILSRGGRVKLVKGNWNESFLNQVRTFPNAKHDEHIDLTCYGVETLNKWFRHRYSLITIKAFFTLYNMEVVIPESIQDITLEQYQKFNALNDKEGLTEYEYSRKILSIFTNIKYNQSDRIKKTDSDKLTNDILEALKKDVPFKDRFELDGVEYGLIPNFDDITSREWFDLNLYKIEDVKTNHKLMAILFRPVINTDKFNNYLIEPYRGTSGTADKMKHMPLNIYNGARFFFSNLARELSNHTLRYTRHQQKKGIKL